MGESSASSVLVVIFIDYVWRNRVYSVHWNIPYCINLLKNSSATFHSMKISSTVKKFRHCEYFYIFFFVECLKLSKLFNHITETHLQILLYFYWRRYIHHIYCTIIHLLSPDNFLIVMRGSIELPNVQSSIVNRRWMLKGIRRPSKCLRSRRKTAAKSNRCWARGRSMAGQHGLPPFFPGGAFPEEPRIAVFHSYFHGRDPFIEGYNAALWNRFWMAYQARPSPPLFPPRMFP